MATTSLIAEIASEFNSVAILINQEQVELRIDFLRIDGRTVPYTLVASCTGDKVSVREKETMHLPDFCPQRHINSDGSFCLYWEGAETLNVVDKPSSRIWWETLYQFLRHQERTKRLRHWPNADQWAHGGAANFQNQAIVSAAKLGDTFSKALRAKKLKLITKNKTGKNLDSTIGLYLDGKFVYSVWINLRRVVNKKQKCFCQRKGKAHLKRIRNCSTHAIDGANLALAMYEWEKSEKHFWSNSTNRNCCETCDDCPLSKNN